MSVMVTADFFIKPERASEFLELLRGALPATRGFAGSEKLDTFVDEDDPGHVLLVEQWSDRAAHERYVEWRTAQGMPEMLAGFVRAPWETRYFDQHPDI